MVSIVQTTYQYPATTLIKTTEYEKIAFKDQYIILERPRGFYKLGFFTTKNNITGKGVNWATEKDREIIWKVLGKKQEDHYDPFG